MTVLLVSGGCSRAKSLDTSFSQVFFLPRLILHVVALRLFRGIASGRCSAVSDEDAQRAEDLSSELHARCSSDACGCQALGSFYRISGDAGRQTVARTLSQELDKMGWMAATYRVVLANGMRSEASPAAAMWPNAELKAVCNWNGSSMRNGRMRQCI
jgi:hypothetical protein